MKQIKDGNWFRVMKRYISWDNLGCTLDKFKLGDSLISIQYLRYVCEELIKWAKKTHQGVLTYD